MPKKPGSPGNVDRYWRLSFQEQERELISGSKTLKPTIKLLKVFFYMFLRKKYVEFEINSILETTR